MDTSNKTIGEKLLECNEKLSSQTTDFKYGSFVPSNPEADDFIRKEPFAFLVAVVVDQSIKAERAWEIPFLIKQRLGHLDPSIIGSQVSYSEMKEIFEIPPKLHRFNTEMSKAVVDAAKLVVDKYSGNASNIWLGVDDPLIIRYRLMEFYRVKQKKSTMATNILVRDLGLRISDRREIDISFDRHVRRVFLRSGILSNDNEKELIEKARELNPTYPGALDLPAWKIGREHCYPKNPDCANCCLSSRCAKLIDRNPNGVV